MSITRPAAYPCGFNRYDANQATTMDKTNDGINGRARAFHPRPLIEVDMKSILFSCLLFGLLSYTPSHAQTACPPGMEEYGAGVCGYSRSEEPAQQAPQQQAPQPPPPKWASRWGAIAMDESPQHGSTGTSFNRPNRSAAEKAALKNCQSNGGTNCKIKSAYDNECVAIVMGNPGGYTVTDTTQDKATQAAMSSCSNHGNTNCHIYYTSCSLPVRIQ